MIVIPTLLLIGAILVIGWCLAPYDDEHMDHPAVIDYYKYRYPRI